MTASGEELRALMRRVPTGVAVATVDVRGERLGLTVGSFLSLSLEPPLVGISVRREAALHELLREAGDLSLSLLAAGQEDVAAHFARGVPPIALWEGVALHPGDGAPLLAGAIGWLRCRVRSEYEAGDHTLFVADVLSVEAGAAGRALEYVEGRYVS